MESELDWAQLDLAASGEAWQKVEEEASRLTDERVSFAHNICRSKPGIPDGMPDTSNPLPTEFINPRCLECCSC